MRPNILVNRYAKAFMELAIQRNLVDKSLDDLRLVKTTFESNKELQLLTHQPFVSKESKINIINKLFEDKVDKIVLNLLHLLIEKNREDIIDYITDAYYELFLEYKKIAVVTITSAVALDEQTNDRIVNIIKHKIVDKVEVKINNVIDKEIIGGFIVRYKDYVYDASVKNTLNRLHSVFEENLFVKEY